jgi:hypothetical protein
MQVRGLREMHFSANCTIGSALQVAHRPEGILEISGGKARAVHLQIDVAYESPIKAHALLNFA